MSGINRREFLKVSLAAGAASVFSGCVSAAKPHARVIGANDEIRVGVIGLGHKGPALIGDFRGVPGVRVVALCDVDRGVLDKYVGDFTKRNEKVEAYIDLRRMIDDPNVDAVAISTPNHWHALATIWACQAGKDVYVEKPVCHNIWEGRQMVKAARKYERIVQGGTQKRSDEGLREAFEFVQKGNIGKILVVRGFCYKGRKGIGKAGGPQPVPEAVNYDLWCGPAPDGPLMRKELHYDWHWFWPTGNGDIGNQGIHEMDLCRWALGEKGLAPRAMSIGGRFDYNDDGETPNTQIAILDYPTAPIIFEVRNLPNKKNGPTEDSYKGIRIGLVVKCENGYFAGGDGGGWVYDNDGKKVKQFSRGGSEGHAANFIKAVRSRKVSDLNADVLETYLSSALVHEANISHQIGLQTPCEQIMEVIKGDKEATETFERMQQHLAANEVDLKATPPVLGPWLKMDVERERFIVGPELSKANSLLTRHYRKPFVVPKNV